MITIACVLLVDRDGRLLMQLRDGNATFHPNAWGLPGGHAEAGETPERFLASPEHARLTAAAAS
ncbi:NUDIX domain-containing protein [Micromonospora avicenniae]|uniref:NUDIX domain-containing protein n=1 Tax=Micromonospora avicenniae TaxID=1198245 RepID=UPI0033270E75